MVGASAPFRSRTWTLSRLAGLGLVAVGHVLAAWVLASGLGHKVVAAVTKPVEARLIAEAKPVPPPPPPPPPPPEVKAPPPRKVMPPAYVPPPPVQQAAPAQTAITAVIHQPPKSEPVPLAAQVAVERVSAKLDASSTCRPPQYPAQSRRNGESGAVVLRFLIDEGGKVVDSQIEASSGFIRLDEAAQQGLSLCRFTPGTVDGKPERSWARMRYVWKLN